MLGAGIRAYLGRYRGFRHVVDNVYDFHLDPVRIEALVAFLPAALAVIEPEVAASADRLEAGASAAPTDERGSRHHLRRGRVCCLARR